MLSITNDNFKEVISNNEIAIIYISAGWCGPCKKVGITMESFSQENHKKENVFIGKNDVDNDPMVSEVHLVKSIPTVIFFKEGVEVSRVVGDNPKEMYQSVLDKI